MLVLSIWLGKLIFFLTRFFKIGGGSAAPGLYALKLDKNLVQKLASQIPQNIIIAGTNGKTTTSRLLSHFLKGQNLKIIHNSTGSNLERGVASTLINRSDIFGKISKVDIGIWELDEAAFNHVVEKISPQIIVFLNAFRDQLDRYGEVDTIVNKWIESIKKVDKNVCLIINGDDVNTSKLIRHFEGKILTFGVSDYKIVGEEIIYQKENQKLDIEAKNVKNNGLKGTSFELNINSQKISVTLPLPGIYHIYDFLGSIAAYYSLNQPLEGITQKLINFSPAFGRVEKVDLGENHEGYIFLIKNPAGATQVFQTIAPEIKPEDNLLLALNDNLADGTDVSWIWDGEFEELVKPVEPVKSVKTSTGSTEIVCSGTRAYDLALRLKYAGFDPKILDIEPSLEKAFKRAKANLKGKLFILPTYTAMLKLQQILAAQGHKKHYWKEEG